LTNLLVDLLVAAAHQKRAVLDDLAHEDSHHLLGLDAREITVVNAVVAALEELAEPRFQASLGGRGRSWVCSPAAWRWRATSTG
jgi:hypothetical protein